MRSLVKCQRRMLHEVRRKPRVVVALGGNALLKKDDPMTGAAQQKNVAAACEAIAKVIGDCELVLTHGNGPQVGLLALHQQESFGLEILDAETQGMIGYMLESELRNILPKTTHVAALLTQVEVDPNDPAFKNPTKPIGPFYNEDRSAQLGPMVRVDGTKFRRVVASPAPKRIVEIDTVRTLMAQHTVVICAGGGGIPVMKNPKTGLLQGVAAVIDKDRTAALLAETVAADGLVMLTDVDGIYSDFGKPTQHKVESIDTGTITPEAEQALLKELPAGSMRPKFEAAMTFVRKTNGAGWAAIGRMEELPEILAGKAGSRIMHSLGSGKTLSFDIQSSPLKKEIDTWDRNDVEKWLRDVVRVPRSAADAVLAKCNLVDGKALKHATYATIARSGINWGLASAIHREIQVLDTTFSSNEFSWVDSEPYRWPYNGNFSPSTTALLVIDMQRDFLDPLGYIGSMGYDTSGTRKAIEPIQRLLQRAREKGYRVIHTREGHAPDLSDCPQVKHWRSMNLSTIGIGDKGPLGRLLVRGEEGWDIVPELAPLPSECIIDKPGKGAFYSTALDLTLRLGGIKNLIVTGVTTDVCVHTTIREANDHGYECLLVTDATAALDESLHRFAIRSVQLSGGIFGATADTHSVLKAMQ